jgi:mRNA-degrading endonuclease toxin of MazEF toxin-antitoxin module
VIVITMRQADLGHGRKGRGSRPICVARSFVIDRLGVTSYIVSIETGDRAMNVNSNYGTPTKTEVERSQAYWAKVKAAMTKPADQHG